jgi:hypothetical protein
MAQYQTPFYVVCTIKLAALFAHLLMGMEGQYSQRVCITLRPHT